MKKEEFVKSWHKSTTIREAYRHAWSGIIIAFKTERNLQVQLVIYILVLAVSFLIQLSFLEIAIVIMVATMILTLEMINTAVEHFSDIVEPRYSDTVGLIKDVSAGAVMLASAASVVIGLLIFVPRIILALF